MIKSSPILPIRIYSDLFDQQRFNIHCNQAEQLDLVYPVNALPSFQFIREMSQNLPEKLYLRNVCNDKPYDYGYYKQVPDPASNFNTVSAGDFYGPFPQTIGSIYDNGVDPPSGRTLNFLDISCNMLVNATDGQVMTEFDTLSADPELAVPIINSGKFSVKIIVEKFLRVFGGSTFSIKVYNGNSGGTLLGTITAQGTYFYEFTSTATSVTLVFDNYAPGDIFKISYLQVEKFTHFSTSLMADALELDETKVSLRELNNGTHILTYCEPDQTYQPDTGTYYYVLVCGTEVYFSEVFKLVSLRDIESYYRLRWKNSCDINNYIIYNETTLGCAFENVLYLDAALFKPEIETAEKGEENNDGELILNYASWKKNINFEILKSPEFLTDALSAVFLHDSVYIQKPLNIQQDVNTSEFSVRRIFNDVANVLQDCFQKVTLKLLLNDLFTKTGCCDGVETYDCTPCDYTAGADCSGAYMLQMSEPPEEGDGLIRCEDDEIIEVDEEDIICFDGKYWSLTLLDGIWQPYRMMPSITSATLVGSLIVVAGDVIPNSFAEVEYNLNGGGWVVHGYIFAGSTGAYTYNLPASLAAGATDFKIRVHNKTLACEFGTTDEYDYI